MPTIPIAKLLDRVKDLHSCPAVVQKVLQLTAEDDYDVGDVGLCLANDPALAGAILRFVNSSHFGLRSKIASLDRATMILGRRSLRLAVLNFGLTERLLAATPAKLFDVYWRRSLTMAGAAQLCIARLGVNREDEDEAYSAGLLADLAVLVFAQFDPQNYAELYLTTNNAGELAKMEQEAYGVKHSVLSSMLLERWGFPKYLVDAVSEYEQLSPEKSMLAQALHAASLLAECLWSPSGGRMPELQEVLHHMFEMDTDELLSLALACKDLYNDAKTIFNIKLTGEIDIEAIRQEAWRQFREVVLDQADLLIDSQTIVGEA